MSPPARGSQCCRQRGAVGLPECLWRWPSGHRRGKVCLAVSRCPWAGLGKQEAVGAGLAVAAWWGEGGGERAGRSCLRPAQSSHDPNSSEHSSHPRSAFLGPPSSEAGQASAPCPGSFPGPIGEEQTSQAEPGTHPEAPPSSPRPPSLQLSQALLINLKVKDLN